MIARRLVVQVDLVIRDDGHVSLERDRRLRRELLEELREGRVPAWVWQVADVTAGPEQPDADSLEPEPDPRRWSDAYAHEYARAVAADRGEVWSDAQVAAFVDTIRRVAP